MSKRGVSDQTPKAPIMRKGVKAETMVTTIERVNMFEMETTTMKTTSTRVTMVIRMIKLGH